MDRNQPRHLLAVLGVLVVAGAIGKGDFTLVPAEPTILYPEALRVDHTDEYHGFKVSDPYRWLEQTDSEQTRKWIEAQNKISFSYLENIPKRQAIKDRLTVLWNFERYGVPS